MTKQIAIVGAGLAGPLLACYLARDGFDVTLYERRGDPRVAGFSGGRSINLALSARGIDALQRIGLADEVLKSVIPRLPNPESSWLVLAMASTLAGNLTLPGSIASIIVVERASGHATITFRDFFKVGAPIAIATMIIGAVWLRFFGP